MDERGRLLERLEHAVGRLVAELVDALDHEHPARGLKRRLARGGDHRLLDVADEDLVGAARGHPGQIGVGAGARARPGAVRVGRAAGEQLRRHRPRRRALARAARAVEQVRVRGARIRSERRREHGAGVRVAVELGEHASILMAGRVRPS